MRPSTHGFFLIASIGWALTGCGEAAPSDSDAGMPPPDGGPSDAAAVDGGDDLGDGGSSTTPDGGVAQDAASACQDVKSALEALADGLLYTSESDYPIEVASFAGEGGTAPTPETVLRLSGLPASSSLETRTVDRFFSAVVVDPTRAMPAPDTQPAALRTAVERSLTDVIVVRVIDPAASAEVRVHLVGRSACGALIWLASTSIET